MEVAPGSLRRDRRGWISTVGPGSARAAPPRGRVISGKRVYLYYSLRAELFRRSRDVFGSRGGLSTREKGSITAAGKRRRRRVPRGAAALSVRSEALLQYDL